MKSPRKNQQGFTLIELLVVVSIVGVLGSVGVSAYSEYRERAYIAASETLLHSASVDLESYIMRQDALTNVVGERRWEIGAASAYEDSNADLILPAVRVSEGYMLYAGIRSFDCGNASRSQYYVWASPWRAESRRQFVKTCSGWQAIQASGKARGAWW